MRNDLQPVKTWVLVVSSLLVALSIVTYVWMIVSAPAFKELFAGFGTELPTLTKLVLAGYQFTPVILLLVLVPYWKLLRNRHHLVDAKRYFRRVIVGFVVAYFIASIFVVGIYMPVFEMGSVV